MSLRLKMLHELFTVLYECQRVWFLYIAISAQLNCAGPFFPIESNLLSTEVMNLHLRCSCFNISAYWICQNKLSTFSKQIGAMSDAKKAERIASEETTRKTKDQRRKTKDEIRKTKGQRRKAKNQRRKTKDERPKTKDQRRKTKGQRRNTKDERPRMKDQRPKTKGQRRKAKDERPKTKDERPKAKDQR